MNRDDIIKMAREAGLEGYRTPLGGIERFADLIAAAEREACALVAEDWDSDSADPRDIAAAIRERSTND